MQGSVERHDMSSQMMLLAHQTAELSERGMPGDSSHITLIPVDGNLIWDSLRGGMWYSATWIEDMSLRARGALDFDDQLEIRHPESFVEAICITDLRLGPDRPYYYALDGTLDFVTFTVTPGLAVPLGPIDVILVVDGEEIASTALRIDDVSEFDLSSIGEASLISTHELTVLGHTGSGGATFLLPSTIAPSDKTGHAWSIPMPSGTNTIHILSEDANQIHITTGDGTTRYYALPTGASRTAVSFTSEIVLDEASVVEVTTSAPSRLLLITTTDESVGLTAWPSNTGHYLGQQFLPPHLNGTLRLSNPGDRSVTATWRGGGISISAGDVEDINWPVSQSDGAATLDVDGDIFVTWMATQTATDAAYVDGTMILPAEDTGSLSGGQFTYANLNNSSAQFLHLRLAGFSSSWNISGSTAISGLFLDADNAEDILAPEGNAVITVEEGHPLRILRTSGDHGLYQIEHDGANRCTKISTQASGWVSTDLPWEGMGGRSEIDIQNAWIEGRHPASMSIDVIGSDGISTHATIGTVWAFHLTRLSYQFQSSIDGMEVAFSGGAVVTNHPEFNPYVVVPPADRGGPGPRFAATIPALHPTLDSDSGAGELELDIELVHRTSLASSPAYEVRRGWSEPYGTAIADAAGIGLESSQDWTVYPGRLDLLTDYVGWVPDPSYGTSEAVWHTNGEVIAFTLQLASLDVTAREVMV